MPSPEYTLNQAGDPRTERPRLALLERYYDPQTIARFERLGVARGWRCVDVGAGGGSIARWLAERTGSSGSVLAIDLDITLLEPLASAVLSVRRLDIRSQELPGNADLVHARFVLEHLPDRDAVLQRLIRGLRPGGLLVVTDADFRSIRLSEPDAAFDRVAQAFFRATRAAGWDPEFGAALPSMLEAAGLEDVCAESFQTFQRGGVAGPLTATTFVRLRDLLVQHGVTAADIARVEKTMHSAGYYSPTSWTAWGRRPSTSET
jgi:SAM-dependent methyltransferase